MSTADPDPTTQIAWPSSSRKNSDQRDSEDAAIVVAPPALTVRHNVKSSLSTLDLITLSISMLGAQVMWTVELGYGTPFLLGLGLTTSLTSLVWLAGPLSGLIAQPLIGAISDASTSKYRRRYWIVTSTIVLALSTLSLAYCQEIAGFLVYFFVPDEQDKGKHKSQVQSTSIGLAIASFYLLDFALNALQASLRNLLLDVTPSSQLNAGNAWHGRMTHAGNIVGFGFGFLPLEKLPIIRLLGGSQFRKFCIVAMAILVVTVWITCACHEEQERQDAYRRPQSQFREVLDNIYNAIINLPKSIRRVCYVQLASFMSWFPFLFYSTTYVGQIMAYEQDKEPDAEIATRSGELAMLAYSIVAVFSGTVLPHLAGRDRRLMAHKGDVDEDAELTRLRNTVRQWKAEAIRKGRPLRLPVMPFLLRNIWTGALVLFAVLMGSTFFISTVWQASIFISLVGICWAVACWVPFAIIMESIKETPVASPETAVVGARRPLHARAISSPGTFQRDNEQGNERTALLRRRSYDEYELYADDPPLKSPLAGGTVLGVHNLAIVFPQFVVALVSSAIFRAVDKVPPGGIDVPIGEPDQVNSYYGKNGVAWVLRFGGLCALFGALLCRRVSPTPTEKQMRRRLGEMRLLREEEQHRT